MITSASSAQKTVDNETVGVDAALGFTGDMVEGNKQDTPKGHARDTSD